MLTRRKSSEDIRVDLPPHKKVKLNKGSEKKVEQDSLEELITDPKTIEILRNRGIQKLFPVQKMTFPIVLAGQDLIGQDRTGSGKTLAYILPICESLRQKGVFPKADQIRVPKRQIHVLVIVPTRELVLQVQKELLTLLHFENEFKAQCVYGGTQLSEQISEVRKGGEWVIATPGRLLDLINRQVIKFEHLKHIVIDEADQMLQFGFQEDIETIFQSVSSTRQMSEIQTMLFSATIPKWMKDLSVKYLKADRKHINLINLAESQAATQVTHYALHCAKGMLVGTVGDVVSFYGGKHCRTIIFCETKAQANDISLNAKIPTEVQVLHGDIAQKQREITFNAFKQGSFKCLVATNVASRGLDFPQVDLIIQLHPPKEVDTYIHRAGRTARAGKTGICITFYTKWEQQLMERIERYAKIKFIQINPPQPTDIIKASLRDLQVSLKEVNKEILPHFRPVAEQITKEMDPLEALCRALAHLSGYKDQITQRSMLGSFEGFITLVIKSQVPFDNPGYVKKFLRNILPNEIVDATKGMRKLKNEPGVVFDFPHNDLKTIQDAFETYIQTDKRKNFTLEIATVLPEIEENQYDNNNFGGNNYGNRGFGNQRGGYQQRGSYSGGPRRPFNNQQQQS